MEKTFDAVIIANGAFPTHAVPSNILHHAAHLIACDGAIAFLLSAGLGEAVIIGDGDSVPAEYRDRLIQIDEQDDNDLTKATRYCVEHGWKRIAYLGCTGKREDHTLGNISLLMRYYRDMDVEGILYTDYGFFTPAHGHRTFLSMKGQQVSIINFGSHQLTSTGLRWDAYNFSEWWQGTLNESLGDSFSLQADGCYLANTAAVRLELATQGIGKALFAKSGGFFTMKTSGQGTLVVSGFGSIHELEVRPDHPILVDNGHLVAWDSALKYEVALNTAHKGLFGSMVQSVVSGAMVVLRFSGKGRVLVSSRSREDFTKWLGQSLATLNTKP